jgi:hypothetical protein
VNISRAKALDKILREMTVSIDNEEIIVGRTTSKVRGGALVPLPSGRSDPKLLERFLVN